MVRVTYVVRTTLYFLTSIADDDEWRCRCSFAQVIISGDPKGGWMDMDGAAAALGASQSGSLRCALVD